MRSIYRLAAVALLCLLPWALACRAAIESPEELQALAGDTSEETAPGAGQPARPEAAAGGEEVDVFPLVGSVFPGLGGRLHSSLCDPASDPYSTCL